MTYERQTFKKADHAAGKILELALGEKSILYSCMHDEKTGYGRHNLNEIGFEILKESDSRSETSRKAIGTTQEHSTTI